MISFFRYVLPHSKMSIQYQTQSIQSTQSTCITFMASDRSSRRIMIVSIARTVSKPSRTARTMYESDSLSSNLAKIAWKSNGSGTSRKRLKPSVSKNLLRNIILPLDIPKTCSKEVCFSIYQSFHCVSWVDWLLKVICNDISVIYVASHRSAGGLEKKLDLRSGFQRHRHFQVPTRRQPSEKPPHFVDNRNDIMYTEVNSNGQHEVGKLLLIECGNPWQIIDYPFVSVKCPSSIASIMRFRIGSCCHKTMVIWKEFSARDLINEK